MSVNFPDSDLNPATSDFNGFYSSFCPQVVKWLMWKGMNHYDA